MKAVYLHCGRMPVSFSPLIGQFVFFKNCINAVKYGTSFKVQRQLTGFCAITFLRAVERNLVNATSRDREGEREQHGKNQKPGLRRVTAFDILKFCYMENLNRRRATTFS